MKRPSGTNSNDCRRPASSILFCGDSSDIDRSLYKVITAGLPTVLIDFLIPLFHALIGDVPLFLIGCGVIASIALLLLAIVEIGKILANR